MTGPKFSSPAQFDHLMLEPVHEMMMTGIKIDQDKKIELQRRACQEWDEFQETLDKVVGTRLNVDSKKFVPQLLYDVLELPKQFKWSPTTRKKRLTADETALRNLMAICKEKVDSLKLDSAKQKYMEGFIICHRILKIRGVRKKISSFLGMKVEKGNLAGFSEFEDTDGRVRGTISVGGTETARFSHSKTLWGTGVNLATVPLDIREMYVPDDGFEMAEFDLNRGESWVYAHLSADPQLLKIHTEGLDFHAETASAISGTFGEPLSVDYIREHKNGWTFTIRYLGKKTNHATSYRMKSKTGADSVNKEAEETGITITLSKMKQAQDIWHQKYFMIRSNWWPEIEGQLSKDRTMRTPYGRVHQFHGFWGEDLFKSATAYVPQSTSVDYLNRGFLKVYHMFQKTGAWGLKVLAQTHDSILVQYKISDREEAVESIIDAMTSELTIKGRTFSIPIEAGFGANWKEAK